MDQIFWFSVNDNKGKGPDDGIGVRIDITKNLITLYDQGRNDGGNSIRPEAGVWQKARLRYDGSRLLFKIWRDGVSESSRWDIVWNTPNYKRNHIGHKYVELMGDGYSGDYYVYIDWIQEKER